MTMTGAAAAATQLTPPPNSVEDLATLLPRLGLGNIRWLIGQVLGQETLAEAGDALNDVKLLARFAAEKFNGAGRLGEAIRRLRVESENDLFLTVGLDRILHGAPLDEPNLQALVNDQEPYFNLNSFESVIQRGKRALCAVGLGNPKGSIVGSGVLIGPDLVLTNHHVIEAYAAVNANRTLSENNPPDGAIYCYFDYKEAPEPTVPPTVHESTPVKCADEWLVYGRSLLKHDGTPQCPATVTDEYDYAVLRLSQPIGRQPAGGGPMRGWFSLPNAIKALTPGHRVIIFQHPRRAPQATDVGQYQQLDPSGTRVWYDVSTSEGSSGGAAVDSDGQLFALHNAEVEARAGLLKKVNQGIRIDFIAKDLRQGAPQTVHPPPQKDPLAFWSLTDDTRDPQPVLGRMVFREYISKMMSPSTTTRVVVVTGPAGRGVRFSKSILRRLVGVVPFAEFTARELQNMSPRDFVRTICDELGVVENNVGEVPRQNSTENIARWLRLDLPSWLARRLSEDQQRHKGWYPAWVIINTIVPSDERLLWADNLRELIAALAGAHDVGQRAIDLPQLRWLFLGRNAAPLPLSGVERYEEDLTSDTTWAEDFADCIQFAWESINREPQSARELLTGMAPQLANGSTAPRQALATFIRNTMVGQRRTT